MLKRILALLTLALALGGTAQAQTAPRSFFEPDFGAYAIGPRGALAPPFASRIDAALLAADTRVAMAIPSAARYFNLSCDGNFWALIGISSTALTIPIATSTDGAAPTLNPGARYIPSRLADGTTVPTHLILRAPGPSTTKCSVEWYGEQIR